MWELTLDTSLENIANTTGGQLEKLRGTDYAADGITEIQREQEMRKLVTRWTWRIARNSDPIHLDRVTKTWSNPACGRHTSSSRSRISLTLLKLSCKINGKEYFRNFSFSEAMGAVPIDHSKFQVSPCVQHSKWFQKCDFSNSLFLLDVTE